MTQTSRTDKALATIRDPGADLSGVNDVFKLDLNGVKNVINATNPIVVGQAGHSLHRAAQMLAATVQAIEHAAERMAEQWGGPVGGGAWEAQEGLRKLHAQARELQSKMSAVGQVLIHHGEQTLPHYRTEINKINTHVDHGGGLAGVWRRMNDMPKFREWAATVEANRLLLHCNLTMQQDYHALPYEVRKDLPAPNAVAFTPTEQQQSLLEQLQALKNGQDSTGPWSPRTSPELPGLPPVEGNNGSPGDPASRSWPAPDRLIPAHPSVPDISLPDSETQLAGLTPEVGAGLGGTSSGLPGGLPGGGGSGGPGSAPGGGSLGAGGLAATTPAGLTARGGLAGQPGMMPMFPPPMTGGQTGNQQDREQKDWLVEDENVWGTEDLDAGPGLIT